MCVCGWDNGVGVACVWVCLVRGRDNGVGVACVWVCSCL